MSTSAVPEDRWPIFSRAEHGNCPFCWAAAWGPHHDECAPRKAAYYAKQKAEPKPEASSALTTEEISYLKGLVGGDFQRAKSLALHAPKSKRWPAERDFALAVLAKLDAQDTE